MLKLSLVTVLLFFLLGVAQLVPKKNTKELVAQAYIDGMLDFKFCMDSALHAAPKDSNNTISGTNFAAIVAKCEKQITSQNQEASDEK